MMTEPRAAAETAERGRAATTAATVSPTAPRRGVAAAAIT